LATNAPGVVLAFGLVPGIFILIVVPCAMEAHEMPTTSAAKK